LLLAAVSAHAVAPGHASAARTARARIVSGAKRRRARGTSWNENLRMGSVRGLETFRLQGVQRNLLQRTPRRNYWMKAARDKQQSG
jgi:hypothetical protein